MKNKREGNVLRKKFYPKKKEPSARASRVPY